MTVTPEPQTQQEPLWHKLAIATRVWPYSGYASHLANDFETQRVYLFPVLNRNGAVIYVYWPASGICDVGIYEAETAGRYGIHEFRMDGDVAACVARALERYWGLE